MLIACNICLKNLISQTLVFAYVNLSLPVLPQRYIVKVWREEKKRLIKVNQTFYTLTLFETVCFQKATLSNPNSPLLRFDARFTIQQHSYSHCTSGTQNTYYSHRSTCIPSIDRKNRSNRRKRNTLETHRSIRIHILGKDTRNHSNCPARNTFETHHNRCTQRKDTGNHSRKRYTGIQSSSLGIAKGSIFGLSNIVDSKDYISYFHKVEKSELSL